jgi:DNA-binding Lrp family transcriptional regulator
MIDEIDYRIIKSLQSKNSCAPRVTYIADELNLPPSSVHARIKKLEAERIITNYSATADAAKLGKPLTVFALIKLDYPKTEKEIEFNETVADKIAMIGPEIQEVHSMTGDWELLVKIKVKDQNAYYDVVKEIIKVGKIINKVNALFALETHGEHNIVYP